MSMKAATLALVLALSLGLFACRKLVREEVAQGTVGGVSIPYTDSIPKEYGALVGISPENDGWTALWFQKPDGTITAVGVNWIERKMLIDAAVITRR